MLRLISIDVTNRCEKGCAFCYNRSSPEGETRWSVGELTDLLTDCERHRSRRASSRATG